MLLGLLASEAWKERDGWYSFRRRRLVLLPGRAHTIWAIFEDKRLRTFWTQRHWIVAIPKHEEDVSAFEAGVEQGGR